MEKNNNYDLSELVQINIIDILDFYGKRLEKNNMFKLRDEKTASAKYYPNTNSFYDFGVAQGGGPIHLVMQLENIDKAQAIYRLGEMFNIKPLNNNLNIDKKCFLTNSQWRLIGIQGDRASKNYEFDFENNSQEYNLKLSEELAISMNDCGDIYPQTFKDIIENKAIPFVNQLKSIYQKDIFDLIKLKQKPLNKTEEIVFVKTHSEKVQESISDYNIALSFLKKATKNFEDIKINFKAANFVKDYEDIQKGRVSFEIGPIPYNDFKKYYIGANVYKTIYYETYKYFTNNPQNEMFIELNPHSAYLKGDTVTLVVKEQASDFYEEFINETKLNMSKQMNKDYEYEIEI